MGFPVVLSSSYDSLELGAVAKLGPAADDVVDARGERQVRGDAQRQSPHLVDGTQAACAHTTAQSQKKDTGGELTGQRNHTQLNMHNKSTR